MSEDRAVLGNGTQTSPSRWARYSKVTLANMCVRRAQSSQEFEIVGLLREQGFGRLADDGAPRQWVDSSDHVPGTFSLLAYTRSGQAIGTLRVQDSRTSVLELASRVPLDSLLTQADMPAAQFARLSVNRHVEGYEAMFALFKAAWRWCLLEGLQSIVIASPPWARPIYDFMCFDDLGPAGHFTHKLAGDADHVSMRLNAQRAEEIWRSRKQPLCALFCDASHPKISANERAQAPEEFV